MTVLIDCLGIISRLRLFKLINQHQTLFEVVTNKKKTVPKKPKVGVDDSLKVLSDRDR